MSGNDSVTAEPRQYVWDEHPRGGWDEFTAARRRHFENLSHQSMMVRRLESSREDELTERR